MTSDSAHEGEPSSDPASPSEPGHEAPSPAGPAADAPSPSATAPGTAGAPADPPVPGDRLGVPVGATHTVVDHGPGYASYLFLVAVSVVSLGLDILTKAWAATHLDNYPGMVEIWPKYVTFVLAKNRGGAWGLLQTTSENVRRPFFLLVSVAAIAFIMTLYRRLQPRQRALQWGLPLVLGGALGNVFDRIRYGHVIDFIDLHYKDRYHWPTFNVADVAICVGVGLMALDMFFSRRGPAPLPAGPRVPPAQSGEPVPDWHGGMQPPAPPPELEPDPPPGAAG